MIPEFITIEDKLLNRLRSVRRGWFMHLMLQCVLGFGGSSALVLGIHWLWEGQLDVRLLNCPLLLWVMVAAGLVLRARPTLGHCAAVFDQVNGNNSRVQIAYELALGRPDSEFALWAIRVGLRSITPERGRKVRLKMLFVHRLQVHLVVLALSLLGTGAPQAALSRIRHGGSVEASAPEVAEVPSVIGVASRQVSATGERGVGGAPEIAGLLAQGGSGAEADVSSGLQASEGRKMGKAPEGGPRGQRQRGETGGQPSSFALSAERSQDQGESYVSDSFELGPQEVSVSSEDMSLAGESGRKDGQERSRTSSSGQPLSLNLQDRALPAGRDVAAEGGEEGSEEPTESPRGDAEGDKSGREIASMLPVMPLPDSISGLLGVGEEVRQQTLSGAEGSESGAEIRRVSAVVREPALPSRHHPRRFRRYINMRNSHD